MAAAEGLRATREAGGLSVESVESAAYALEEELREGEDIGRALEGRGGGMEVDGGEEEELLAELEGLLREEDEGVGVGVTAGSELVSLQVPTHPVIIAPTTSVVESKEEEEEEEDEVSELATVLMNKAVLS